MILEKNNPYISSLDSYNVLKSMDTGTPLSVKIENLDIANNFIKCKISDKIFGIMQIEEFDPNLKELKDHLGRPYYPQIDRLMKGNISALATKQISSDSFAISRKQNIIKCYNTLKNEKKVDCCVIGKNKEFIFVDCGMGVNGKIYKTELVNQPINKIEDANLDINDEFQAIILSSNDKHFRFILSKRRFSDYNYSLSQVVRCKICSPITNSKTDFGEIYSSFFVEILPNHTRAILNASHFDGLKCGDTVEAYIYKINSKRQCKLKLINKL